MDDPKVLLLDMGFTDDQITAAINATNSSDIGVLVSYIENSQSQQPQIQQPNEPNQIAKYVKQEDVAMLMSEGFSLNVAQKAILFSNNKGVDAAKKWIEEHKADADFEEELQVVGEKRMSAEEASFKARELQQKLRDKRRIAEEEAAFEQEKNRIKSGKAMNDVRRELEDQKKRLAAEQAKRERMQFLKEKEDMEEQLRREKEARFGKSFGGPAAQKQQQKNYSPIELFEVGIKQIKIAQPQDLLPDVAMNSLTLISKILENILKNPQEPKFRKISLTSQVYQNKIDSVFGAKNALDGLGFIEQEGFYVIETQDLGLLQKALTLTQNEMK